MMSDSKKTENVMRKIKVAKVTLNIGTGKEKSALEKGTKLIKHITGIDPVVTKTKKRIPSWGLRPGLAIGCKLTLRGKEAEKILERLLHAKDRKLSRKQFDNEGNFSFGIPEYIDIQNIKYNPEIGITGLEVAVTLERPGFRIKRKKIGNSIVPRKHRISREDSIAFISSNFNVKMQEDEE